MHPGGHSNRAICSLELALDKMDQDRICDSLQGIAAFSLTVSAAAGFGLVTCLSLAC